MEHIYLQGSENVYRAGDKISEAANQINQSVSWMEESFQNHRQFLDEWLGRFEQILENDYQRKLRR